MQERKQIGLILIATNKYKQFVQQFIDSANKYFCVNHDVTIVLFCDELIDLFSERIKVIQLNIPSYRFPEASLYRYKLISDNQILLSQFDQLFYSDVDMKFVDFVGDEIFSEGLTAVTHPGYYKGGWGSPNNNPLSTSYLPHELRKTYVAGGFQGGYTRIYLMAAKIAEVNIRQDLEKNIMAEWHDETHWNLLANTYNSQLNLLSPSYCYPEASWFDKQAFEPKLIALDKNHKELRS